MKCLFLFVYFCFSVTDRLFNVRGLCWDWAQWEVCIFVSNCHFGWHEMVCVISSVCVCVKYCLWVCTSSFVCLGLVCHLVYAWLHVCVHNVPAFALCQRTGSFWLQWGSYQETPRRQPRACSQVRTHTHTHISAHSSIQWARCLNPSDPFGVWWRAAFSCLSEK